MAKKNDLSKMGKKGGKARAKSLSPAERQEIARRGATARWAKAGKPTKDKPFAEPAGPEEMPWSMFRGDMTIGSVGIECHVLNDLRRVMSQREIVKVISGGRESGHLAPYLNANPLVPKDFLAGVNFQFRVPGIPTPATGFEGTMLIDLCTKYLEAQDQGLLRANQRHLARQAEIVIRTSAKVGIIALIDEATGFQKVRAKHALQLKLQTFIAEEIQEWALMFPEEFWLELARLEGVRYQPRHRPLRWGKYVMMFVYDAIDKDVGRELRKKNPNPRFLKNHHQWLKDYGREKVDRQIARVITIMKLCENMGEFRAKFAHVFRVDPHQIVWDDFLRPD